MLIEECDVDVIRVALHPEGVDRNVVYVLNI